MQIELLSPAGSYESLKACINAGADAVYLGGKMFGARAFANNLSNEELVEAIDYVHVHGKQLYLTLNTLLKDEEIENYLYEYVAPLYQQGLDAVIVQDYGVIHFLKQHFPNLPIHASTQMTVTGIYGAKALQEMGIARVVTARELSLSEIRAIRENTELEIESFIHGALCYCYSGQCLFSSMIGGRSGNRGRCAQPCRLPFQVLQNNKKCNRTEEQYPLSLKDMNTLQILPEIIQAGVTSLKIEGRMKNSQYTAGVTAIYRKYIDQYLQQGHERYKVSHTDQQYLLDLYSRNGSTTGYYKQHNSREMVTLSKPGYATKENAFTEEIIEKYITHNKQRQIQCDIEIIREMPVKIQVYDEYNSISMFGEVPVKAQNKPLTKEVVFKQMNKTGDSLFCFSQINIVLEEDLFLTISELNRLRREALELFQQAVTQCYKRELKKSVLPETKISQVPNVPLKVNCYVEQMNQYWALVKRKEINAIYLDFSCVDFDELNQIVNTAHENKKEIYLALPLLFREKAAAFYDKMLNKLNNSDLDGYLVRNIDEYEYFHEKSKKPMIFDHSMYAFNKESKALLKELGAKYLTLPLELNYKELKKRGCEGEELIVYGYLSLMTSAGCIKKTLNNCNKKEESLYLKDRYQKKFLVKNNCLLCYNTIYNCEPLSLLGVHNQVKDLNCSSIRLNFTIESPEDTLAICNNFVNGFLLNKEFVESENYTRGHFKRGVE